MTLDEALSQAVEGVRVTAPHMQPGCYVEHSFSRGFLRCWRVDAPNEEPDRTQCDFIAGDLDRNAEWRILTSEEQYPPKPKLTGGWGSLKASPIAAKVWNGPARDVPPIADVIDLTAATPVDTGKPAADLQAWAKSLDPRKGGW